MKVTRFDPTRDLLIVKGIDGLIGLSFLRQLNYEIRSIEGRILAERAAP